MSELIYFGSILMSFAVLIVGALGIWAMIEGVYWVYCKAKGSEF
jgi:hypothetical protein